MLPRPKPRVPRGRAGLRQTEPNPCILPFVTLFSHFRRNFYAVMNSDIMTVEVIALLEDRNFGLLLQFTNFRD